jgi:hypothetical protein
MIRKDQAGTPKVSPVGADERNMTDHARSVVVVSNHGSLIERLVIDAGFEVVGQAEVAVNAERLIGYHEPDIVVVENELLGITGVQAMPDLHAASPSSQFVLVVADDWTPANRGEVGAFSVMTRSRLTELGLELGALDEWLQDNADSDVDGERRTGRDRRVKQDWSKVGWERRSGQRRSNA